MDTKPLEDRAKPDKNGNARAMKIAADLRGGRKVTDLQFDQILPAAVRKFSTTHWTPVEVAIRAAELLVTTEKTRVLDIGSGAGKFCLIGALTTRGQFIGIEQRPHLLQSARKTAEALGAHQATFIPGNMADLDWGFFDAFYLFNPFYENVLKTIRIDDSVSHSQVRYTRSIDIVRAKLRSARPGTRVVTYHGFGGEMPFGYLRLKKEAIGTSYLELWTQLEFPRHVLNVVQKSQDDTL